MVFETVTKQLDSVGVRHLGVTREEYGSTLGYRMQTLRSITTEALRLSLGWDSHLSEANRRQADEPYTTERSA